MSNFSYIVMTICFIVIAVINHKQTKMIRSYSRLCENYGEMVDDLLDKLKASYKQREELMKMLNAHHKPQEEWPEDLEH